MKLESGHRAVLRAVGEMSLQPARKAQIWSVPHEEGSESRAHVITLHRELHSNKLSRCIGVGPQCSEFTYLKLCAGVLNKDLHAHY